MILRELSKRGSPGTWKVWVSENNLCTEEPNGGGSSGGQEDHNAALKQFEKELNKKLKLGWAETESSISRRVFQNTTKGSGKYWIIWINENNVGVQYGKITKNMYWWGPRSGQTKLKEFADRNATLKSYEKMIAEKLAEGYQEIHSRKTEFSELGIQLAEEIRAKPKVVRKVKEVPVEENLSKLLGEKPTLEIRTDITNQIDLDPEDWFWAGERKWTALKLPPQAEFDKDACLRRVSAISKYEGDKTIASMKIPLNMTASEAQFWFEVLTRIDSDNPPSRIAERLAKKKDDEPLTHSEIEKRLKQWKGYMGNVPSVLRCLAALMLPKDILTTFLTFHSTPYWSSGTSSYYADAFTRSVLVYLSEAELKDLRETVRPRLQHNLKPNQHNPYYPLTWLVASRLRCHSEIIQIVQSWPDNGQSTGWPGSFYPEPTFLFGLGNPELIASEVRRVKLSFHYDGPKLLRALLATTGFRALDVAANAIRETTNRDRREDLLKVFARIRAPEGAVHMLDLSQSCKAPRIAGEWLQTDVGNAIAGLIPVGAGSGKLAGAATEYLREKKREGHVQLIIAALKSQTTEVAAKIREQVLDRVERVILELTEKTTPRWLASALNASGSLRPLPKSEFVDVARLPPIVVNEGKLERRQTAAVLLALQHATTAERGELITKLKDHAEPDSLDAFAWSLFEQWTAEGGPPKQRWAMMSLGYFGSDAVALRLTPLIRAWPGESQHPRAVAGLECLRAMGTDTALMQLNGMAVKLKFKALQTKAREYMELIAAEKGLTASELEDRIVPDCDLDQRGSRIFDFGSRKFRFVLGSDMKPMLKDDDDKIKSDLPKPSTKDDAAKAAEAINAWKLLKKQVKDVATIQSQRLEQAMVTGRRWSVADFETLLVKHPLMTNLVRLILWAGYDRAGKLVDLFRVTEDQTYANSKDEAYSVNAIAKVGIVHALEINDQQKSPWGEIFSDYELVPPFPQLGRPTYTLDENELRSNTIKRFADVEIPCATLVFGLEKLGWQRGLAQDNGQVNGHSKYFPSADVSAVVIFEDGFPTGYREGWEDQTIADIYFVPAQHRVTWGRRWNNDVTAIPLKKLDLVIVSEVLYDLTALAAKGK